MKSERDKRSLLCSCERNEWRHSNKTQFQNRKIDKKECRWERRTRNALEEMLIDSIYS